MVNIDMLSCLAESPCNLLNIHTWPLAPERLTQMLPSLVYHIKRPVSSELMWWHSWQHVIMPPCFSCQRYVFCLDDMFCSQSSYHVIMLSAFIEHSDRPMWVVIRGAKSYSQYIIHELRALLSPMLHLLNRLDIKVCSCSCAFQRFATEHVYPNVEMLTPPHSHCRYDGQIGVWEMI